MSREFHLERVVGRVVYDCAGKVVGRLGEARTRRDGNEVVLVDYLAGSAAMLERFSATGMARAVLEIFGVGRAVGYVIPWHLLDVADPARPRCLCPKEYLQSFRGSPPPA